MTATMMNGRRKRLLQSLTRATSTCTPTGALSVRTTFPRHRDSLRRSTAIVSALWRKPGSPRDVERLSFITSKHSQQWMSRNVHFASSTNCRNFSQDINNSYSIEEMEIESMRTRVPKLLCIPIGDFDADCWFEADDTLKWWSVQRTAESVHTSFKLLDRLVEELKVIPPEQRFVSDDLMTYFEARTIVPNMIRSWFEVYKEEADNGIQNKNTRGKGFELTAEMILQRMDRYAQEVPWAPAFRLPGKAISYLYNATLLKPEPYDQTAPFCDYLIDRLLEVIPTRDVMSVYMVNTALDLWAKSRIPERVQRAESLFTRACDHKVKLDNVTYNTLLSVYASEGLGSKAETLLQALLQDYLHAGEERRATAPAPDSIAFHTVALAYANSRGGIEAAQRAEFIVQRLLDPFDDYGRLGIEISTILFNTVILAYSRSNVPQAGDEAYRVLQEMRSIDSVKPDQISYGTVMDAYSRCDMPDMAEKVFEEQLATFRETGDESIRPGTLTMTLLIQSYSRSSHPRKAEKAKGVLDRIFELREEGILLQDADTWTYNAVLGSIVSSERSKETAARAEDFVEFMKDRARTGDSNARPDGWTYCELIMIFLDIRDLHKAEHYARESYEDPTIDLDIRTVGRFIIAVAKQGWAQKADFWLNNLLDKCARGDGKAPSISLLGATVSSWYRHIKAKPEAVDAIERLVTRFEELYEAGVLMEGPDNKAYGTIIASLARTKARVKVAARALAILQNMRNKVVEDKRLARWMSPLTASYRDVLRILIGKGRIHEASELLQQMFNDFRSDSETFPMPDSHCVAEVLTGWSETSSSDAWEKANTIFRQTEDAIGQVDPTGRRLPIRDKRCYSAMITLAQKNSLLDEVAALSKALQDKEKAGKAPTRRPWQRKKRSSGKI